MVDSNENILVEFDYDNITLIDPNKIIDDQGNVKERLVKQENLVFYANLECNVLPRTKLALGTAFNDQQKTITVGKINFLNPGFKDFMDTSWSDELTGKDTLQGRGVNQPKLESVTNPNKSDDFYFTQSTYSNGTPGSVDTGLLGIKDINVSMGQDFLPVVEVTLEDVKGRALFEGGNNSPYSAFFQLPYPMFTLTLKGYYGKAIKYPLMLQSFTSNFDPSSHNFLIRLKFYGYKYTILSYINWGSLMAVPHMYKNLVTQGTTFNVTNASSKEVNQAPILISRGYEKMKEVYSIYKSKGLIDDDFPELTINQLRYRLDTFIKNILEEFTKNNLGVLTDITNYTNSLLNYQQEVYTYLGVSWFNKYMDTKDPFILNNGEFIYTFKAEENTPQNKIKWASELKKLIETYNNQLNTNSVFGNGENKGFYVVGGKKYPSTINFDITPSTFIKKPQVTEADIDWVKTYQYLFPEQKTVNVQDPLYLNFVGQRRSQFSSNISNLFYFEGPGSFMDITNKISRAVEEKRKEIEQKILQDLELQFNNRQTGLGFVPTIRNILAIFYCQGEAFLRLMDDVHTKAWDQRENPYRRNAIFLESTTAPSVDVKTSTQNNEPVYPWPQVIQETVGPDKEEKYEIVYPGAGNLAAKYRSFVPEIWPEVEFVEEFIKGFTHRDEDFNKLVTDQTNLLNRPKRLSLNSIDFPVSNVVYQNKQQAKFLYEIYERVLLNGYYSKLNRISSYPLSIYQAVAEMEQLNILVSLGQSNPYLSQILKQYQIDQNNFEAFLRHISNNGQGESWQEFIRGNFTTEYIKNEVENPSKLYNNDIIKNGKSQPDLNIKTESNKLNVTNYIGESTSSNEYDFTDIYPLPNYDWDKKYLSKGDILNSANEVFDTRNVLDYNENQKTITNFQIGDNAFIKRPITNFNYLNLNQALEITNLKFFYTNRSIENQFITEGNVKYGPTYDGNVSVVQTTSILNTPYFINAIQSGLYKFRYRQNETSPYKAAAYLFLESLPLATTKEKYKTYENDQTTELNYILSTLKKFGGVHKLPYAWILKYGGIWNRYKTWIETGVDFLDEVWGNFNYKYNFDPINSATTKNYPLTIDGTLRNIVLDQTTGTPAFTDINVGFYPKLIDDFNVFLQGTKLFSGATTVQGVCSISGSTMTVDSINGNNIFIGATIVGNGISGNTVVISQINGTTGGVGQYLVSPPQTATTTNFTIENFLIVGPSVTDMQTLINNKDMYMINTSGSNIIEPLGYDPLQPARSLRVTPWSVLVRHNNSVKNDYFVFPSFGSNINQTYDECFTNNILNQEVSQNNAMYNGSVRLYWNAPNYGYFDNNALIKNSPDSYFKEIYNNTNKQENFKISYQSSDYSKLDDMFSAFDKSILDLFEEQFLSFSKSVYDFVDPLPPTLNFTSADLTQPDVSTLNSTQTTSEVIFKNFQTLMRELLLVKKPSGNNPNELFNDTLTNQNITFQSVLKSFMEYDVVFKYGNPSSFDRKLFFTFSTQFIADPLKIDPYIPGNLPGDGSVPAITLSQSQTQNPETWKSLYTYVGYSEIPELKYSNSGSYLTDFFITMNVGFNEENVKNYAPLIKIFATQKLSNNNLTNTEFYTSMDNYLVQSKTYINNIIGILMPSLRKELPITIISPQESNVKSNLEAGFTEQTRTELWETFKAMNDTWIAGYDFTNKTLFEDILLMDRASRDIGNKIIVDIFEIKEIIEGYSYKNTLLGTVESVLKKNNFVTYMLPSYINFYNVQDAQKNPTPRPDGSTEFANTLFGTFLNVDYRNSSPKYVCIYANKPSEHLDMKDNIDYRFRSDAFDLRRSSDNPLLENQINKSDWARSNKVVGFNIDITLQNQQIFKQFDVAQDPGKPTSESLQVLNEMANLTKNRRSSTQNVSLYNLYKNRSYRCSVDMMGNALIQPTMYFNIRNIPMFSGPYMITSVKHRVSENGFDTIFEGIRQPFYSLPKINNFLQSLNQTIITTIQEQIQQNETKLKSDPNVVINEKNNILSNVAAQETLTANQDCKDQITPYYNGFTQVETPVKTTVNFNDMYKKIFDKLVAGGYNQNLDTYTEILFTFLYVDSSTNQGFEAYENNFSTIDLRQQYGGLINYVNRKYYCVNRGTNVNYPIVSFIDADSFIDFALSRVIAIPSNTVLQQSGQSREKLLSELFVKFYPLIRNENVWDQMEEKDRQVLYDKFKLAITTYESVKK